MLAAGSAAGSWLSDSCCGWSLILAAMSSLWAGRVAARSGVIVVAWGGSWFSVSASAGVGVAWSCSVASVGGCRYCVVDVVIGMSSGMVVSSFASSSSCAEHVDVDGDRGMGTGCSGVVSA